MGALAVTCSLVPENLQPTVQYVHEITKTDRSPEVLAFGVVARDPNLAALDPPLFHPAERAIDQGATHTAAALASDHHQIRDLGALDFDHDGGRVIDPNRAKAQESTIALANEDCRFGVAEPRGEQAANLDIRVGAHGKERIAISVVLGQRDPERHDPVEIARMRAANASAVNRRGRGLRQLASS
jgi:hypothetical protein